MDISSLDFSAPDKFTPEQAAAVEEWAMQFPEMQRALGEVGGCHSGWLAARASACAAAVLSVRVWPFPCKAPSRARAKFAPLGRLRPPLQDSTWLDVDAAVAAMGPAYKPEPGLRMRPASELAVMRPASELAVERPEGWEDWRFDPSWTSKASGVYNPGDMFDPEDPEGALPLHLQGCAHTCAIALVAQPLARAGPATGSRCAGGTP